MNRPAPLCAACVAFAKECGMNPVEINLPWKTGQKIVEK